MLTVLCLVGCGNKPAVKYLRFCVGAEPETLDPRKMTDEVGGNIAAQLFEGLTVLDDKAVAVPAAAERWEVSPDGLTYTFYLRPDAKWSNGDQLTAQDFEFAWKTALSPEVASRYAYQLFCLKNGENYNKGRVPVSEVGVTAVDDKTLKVVLERPTAYFSSLTAFHSYYPVHRQTVKSNPDWANDAGTIIGNGPFKIVSWTHNNKIEFAKNPYYWDAAKVKLDKMEFILVDNENTELAMFDNNQADMGRSPVSAAIPRLIKEGKLKIYPLLATYFYCFNVTKPPLDNLKVRQALLLAIDREAIIKNVTKGEQKAALAWVPSGLSDAVSGSEFRTVGGNFYQDNDIAAARKLLAEAGYPDGRGLPPITLIYNTNEGHKSIAEAVQEMWRKNLGVEVSLMNQEWKVFINTRNKGDFQIARHGWSGDYADPMTFIDLFTSDSGNNDAQYRNAAYDALVALAKTTNDQAVRMKAMHDAEKMLMDDAIIAPVYYYTNLTYVKPYVKGYRCTILGTFYFKEAYLE